MEILKTQNIVKRYAAHTALSDVSISVPEGCIYGLLGPNGAGKTSLIRIINQITGPDEGQVWFKGTPLAPEHISRIGYLPEERGLYKKMEVGEQLLYLGRLKGLSVQQVKERIKVWGEKFEMQTWWHKKVEDLSKGMQQKVQFVATVLHQPELIILDEPFSGFDPINANLIKEEILGLRAKGSTIIFSTHRMESVEELCDYIALINRSQKVLEGKKADIKQQYRTYTYTVETNRPLPELPTSFELLASKQATDGHIASTVRIKHGSPNDLLAAIMGQVEVSGLRENIPSMNEIFISKVQEGVIAHPE